MRQSEREKERERKRKKEESGEQHVGYTRTDGRTGGEGGSVCACAGVKSRGGGGCRENSEVAREDRGLHRLRWLRDVYKSMIKGLAGGVDRGRGVLGDSSEKTVGMARPLRRGARGQSGGGGWGLKGGSGSPVTAC